ncbi:TIGR03915 family putative DNA repair protein [Terrimonas sp. NA20]|uniref:TIGR03915 family putative DNA repair protein n=1 Tax=Terrimonas ginsenosidimutans TaxID=2908004 RepID=A0ABS9KNQ7_9BACT|nr:TIGR03915 family putative DNA repair protein [Terrimonas ginsenosidimutans]MCG2613948.1 TIGR03915 family putative DNA repair protein [Terrimonas ginsenosidimutans]
MKQVVYDGSFAGLLTAIFEVYEYKLKDVTLCREGDFSPALFEKHHVVYTNEQKAKRVMAKLNSKMSTAALSQFYRCFLAELSEMDNCLLRYAKYTVSSKNSVENNYRNPDVLLVQQISRKVYREKHRMEAFVRFKLTGDGLYYSVIQPDYNVLPLILKHFRERYADQRWLIYDVRRKYGIHYDGSSLEEVSIDFGSSSQASIVEERSSVLDEKEELCQQLWQQYFSSVNIPERKNMKLHIRHMPKRYWRYLTEKMA